jgi:VanZ family protein
MKALIQKFRDILIKLRWVIWSGYAVAWSLALLTPQPIHMRDAVLSERPATYSSKILHIFAYLVFTVLSGWLRLPVPHRWFLLAFLSLHAVATEFLQQFVPLRTPSVQDVAFDHLGIFLGLLVTWKWWAGMSAERPASER